jgi:hypothetical protein
MSISDFIFMWCVFALFLILSSCASIPDTKFVKPLPWNRGAYETSTLSDHKKDYTQAEWDAVSWRYLCISPEEYAKLKASQIKMCKAAGPRCMNSLEKIDKTNEFLDNLMKGIR